jgi:hypothetical protein
MHQCSKCFQYFVRKDVLVKHIRVRHLTPNNNNHHYACFRCALNDMVENEGMSSPPQSSLSSSSPSLPLSLSSSTTRLSLSYDPDYDADDESNDSDDSDRQPQVQRRYRFHPRRILEKSDSMNERRFLSNLRMSKSIFKKLLVEIAPHLPLGSSTNRDQRWKSSDRWNFYAVKPNIATLTPVEELYRPLGSKLLIKLTFR